MKKLLVALVLSIVTITLYSQSNTVMVKSVETYGTFALMKRSLHIVNEKGETQTIELEKHNTNGIPKNMVTIKNTLDKYLNDGYKLISSTAVSFGENADYTIEHTYIFKKEQKLSS